MYAQAWEQALPCVTQFLSYLDKLQLANDKNLKP